MSARSTDAPSAVDELLERLKREGMLFEPSPGFIQKI